MMGRVMQRLRGVVGMGLTWAVVGGLLGMIPRWLLGYNPDAPFPIIFGVFGFAAGVVFSTILMFTERRRRFEEMSLPRFATWGGVGGLLLSAGIIKLAGLDGIDVVTVPASIALASAACAAGTLALARRDSNRQLSDARDAELPDGDAHSRLSAQGQKGRVRMFGE